MKINYCVVTQVGNKRRTRQYAPEKLIERHLRFLENNHIDIDTVTVIINADIPELFTTVRNSIKNTFSSYYTDLEILMRPNEGFAFGGWNDLVNARLDAESDFTHYFFFEDDYVPHRPDFIELFMSLVVDSIGYVRSASHPSGMLVAEAGRETRQKFGSVFDVEDEVLTYVKAEHVEAALLNNLIKSGYTYAYISDIVSAPYLEKFESEQKGRVIEYGVPDVPPAIVPIFRPEETIVDPVKGIQYDISLLQ
jgi:hypothetical protein